LNRFAVHLVCLVAWLAAASLLASPARWEDGPGFRSASLDVPGSGKAGFTILPPAHTGILWTNLISDEQVARRYNMVSGAGVAAGDFDRDGFCDLYLCNRGGDNALFRNLGAGRFQNVTVTAGVACPAQSSVGAAFADLDGDGRLDLVVSSFFGPNACFLNLGNGRFTNVTQSAGLLSRGGATSLALGDLDADGDLDLYFAYFGIESILREGGRLSFSMVNGQPVVTGRHARRLKITDGQLVELGEQDVLYLNDGQARFTVADWARHFRNEDDQPLPAAPMDFGLSVQIRDINEDGSPDIYVCNDFQTPDRLWLNDGKGHFRALPWLAKRNMSYASMGADFADIDRDGRLDFITVDMLGRRHEERLRQMSSMPLAGRRIGAIEEREAVPRNALYWNRGDGTYAEIAWYSGVEASDWSWTPIFLDADLDGYEDLLVSAGTLYDVMDRDATAAATQLTDSGVTDPRKLLPLYPRLDNPNAAFRNRGDLTFEDVSRAWGFDARLFCQGAALADLDNDGDMDVVMNRANGPPVVFRNESAAPRVAVRLKGSPPNTYGIGSKIKLLGGAVPVQSQEVICGGRYLSGDQPMRVFAAGSATNAMRIEVTWRSGKRSHVTDVRANRIYEVDEALATQPKDELARALSPEHGAYFEDMSALLNHTHRDEEFDDFRRQPLLPRKLSQPGPGVAWQDIDEDGWDDLIIGSGKGGKLACYRNNRQGGFELLRGASWDAEVARDQTGIAGTGGWICAGSANYEDAKAAGGCAQIYQAQGTVADLPGQESSTGPVALADMDADGSLEMFVGGRVLPGRYPEPASSLLFRNRDGRWEVDAGTTKVLARIGLVNGAVWSDLDGDGFPELILACEWGPIRLFWNRDGKLAERTLPLRGTDAATLREFTGWWNGVTTGDFDGDGRMDIVAGNWGLNSSYRASLKRPRAIYFADLSGRGATDLVEAYYDEGMKAEVPDRDLQVVSLAMPFVRTKFSTHAAYAKASLQEIYGERLQKAKVLRAATLASAVFLNRGDHFEHAPLPAEAQFSPALATCVGDMDGDGDDDIFLSQNFFATPPGSSRQDAGRGLWLEGDGHGHFQPTDGRKSGIKVYGEQRGAALGDYDQDGRMDLVVTQNGAATRLYRNVRAAPGLRVRLAGPKGNASGIGAQVRVVCGKWKGPVREIHAGSGYLSQDSFTQVLCGPEAPTAIWVRWPGGKEATAELPPKAKEIELGYSGEVRILR